MIYLQRFIYFIQRSLRPQQSRTVRYAFPLVFVVAALLGAATITNSTASYIRIATQTTTVKTGELFTIDVFAGAHVAVNAVDVAITFPKDQIEIKGIDTGESVITIWTEEPYVENNTVHLQGGTFRKGFQGEHLIAQINAQAKKGGSAKFTAEEVRFLAGDGRGTVVSVSDSGEESLTLYVDMDPESPSSTIEGTVRVGIYTDIDGNGKVDMSDIRSFMLAWSDKKIMFDFNNDGRMTFVDFAIILADSFFK